jgi:hypothetical protein
MVNSHTPATELPFQLQKAMSHLKQGNSAQMTTTMTMTTETMVALETKTELVAVTKTELVAVTKMVELVILVKVTELAQVTELTTETMKMRTVIIGL